MRRERIIGRAHGHDLRMVEMTPQSGEARARIYVSAGIHGDEPAGVVAVREFLANPPEWAEMLEWTILPCLNPAGVVANTRCNPAGLDLNRQFRRDDVPEVSAVKKLFARQRFDICVHLHEDCDGTGYYIYELNRTEHWIGEQIIEAAREVIPPDHRPRIERRRSEGGIIRRNPRVETRKLWPEALWAYKELTDHTITTETPTKWPLEERVRVQLSTLEVIAAMLAARQTVA